jgi:site-specific DNA recombinase
LREAARRVLEFGEPVGAICRDWNERGIKPVAAKDWQNTSLVLTLTSARLAGFREWQGQKYPTTQWPAIFDLDTHERLVKLFHDPARRRGAVRRHVYLLSGMPVCPKCGRRMYYRDWKGRRADSYACIEGPGRGCGGAAIKAELLEEYVTGAVLNALESPRVQEALRAGYDPHDTRRAGLLADIEAAQERRADARRDYAEGMIDRADWLDIRDRTEQAITTARREYDRLSGSATVMSDIPASERVRDAWESWNVSRRRAAIKAVLHRIVIRPLPPGMASNPGGALRDGGARREREMAVLRQRVEFDWRV